MKFFVKPLFCVAAIGFVLTAIQPSFAQSTRNMKYLTAEERKDFSRRIQRAGASYDRSKVTAEMNKIIQQRQYEERQRENEKALKHLTPSK